MACKVVCHNSNITVPLWTLFLHSKFLSIGEDKDEHMAYSKSTIESIFVLRIVTRKQVLVSVYQKMF